MINTNRIVPVQKTDFLTLIGTVLTIANVSYTALEATTIEGAFSVTGSGSAGTFLANQPVQSLDFPSGVTGATVYFVPAFDFTGITVAGAAVGINALISPTFLCAGRFLECRDADYRIAGTVPSAAGGKDPLRGDRGIRPQRFCLYQKGDPLRRGGLSAQAL